MGSSPVASGRSRRASPTAMDDSQKWAIASTREALLDYGYPERPLNTERTAVILGNALGGELHYRTVLARVLPGICSRAGGERELRRASRRLCGRDISAGAQAADRPPVPGDHRRQHARGTGELRRRAGWRMCSISAARTSSAMRHALPRWRPSTPAIEGLAQNEFDVAVTGGVDRNMGASTFIKFCKIGALSGTGSRPYAEGADGFVMGEGSAIFIMKRLGRRRARRRQDLRGGARHRRVQRRQGKGHHGAESDRAETGDRARVGKRGLSPATATLIEGHGTSTSVGDAVEFESLAGVLKDCGVPAGSVALGSVKSNIGHLKGAAGAAGILKTALALRDKVLPPSVQCEHPNPNMDLAHAPLYINGQLQPWTATVDGVRRAGVSAFGFGGTNFHAVIEEYVPHRLTGNGKRSASVAGPRCPAPATVCRSSAAAAAGKPPLRGAMVIGGRSASELAERLHSVERAAAAGQAPPAALPFASDLPRPSASPSITPTRPNSPTRRPRR